MSKILIFSDIHVHKHKKSVERLHDCLKVLNWIFDIGKKEQVSSIIFAGDLFHERQIIDVMTYIKTFKVISDKMEEIQCNFYMLLGNHDLWFSNKTEVSSVFPFSAIDNFIIISKPSRYQIHGSDFDFIPFTEDPIESLKQIKKESKSKARYAVGHIALHGAKMNSSKYSVSEFMVEHDGDMVLVDDKIFGDYEQVFLGHYHLAQKMGNVEYIGSPLQLSFGEAFQEKHVIILDVDTGKKKYIKNEFSPKHLILKKDELENFDLKNNFIQVYVDDIGASDLVEMKKEIIGSHEVGSLGFRLEKKKITKEEIDTAKNIALDGDQMLIDYMEAVGTEGLDRDKLLEVEKSLREKNIEGSNN